MWTPHHDCLLEDLRDGKLFLNYLETAFEHFPDGPIDHDFLAAHAKNISQGLKAYQSDPGVRVKYEWMTMYHNYVCHTFAEQYSYESSDEDDLEQLVIGEEAQRVLEHIVPCKSQPSGAVIPTTRCAPTATAPHQQINHQITSNVGSEIESGSTISMNYRTSALMCTFGESDRGMARQESRLDAEIFPGLR